MIFKESFRYHRWTWNSRWDKHVVARFFLWDYGGLVATCARSVPLRSTSWAHVTTSSVFWEMNVDIHLMQYGPQLSRGLLLREVQFRCSNYCTGTPKSAVFFSTDIHWYCAKWMSSEFPNWKKYSTFWSSAPVRTASELHAVNVPCSTAISGSAIWHCIEWVAILHWS